MTAPGALFAGPPLVRTGTSTPAYSVFSENDPSNPSIILYYKSITAAAAYKGMSSEELRVQDYQQDCKTAVQTPHIDPATQSLTRFESLFTSQQRAADSILGDNATGALEATTSQLATVPFGVTGKQRPSTCNVTPFWRAKPTTGFGSTIDQPTSHMFDPGKVACIEELLIKSLLGEDFVDTQFHLYSARSPTLGRVIKPRILCASNTPLAKSSKYFLDLLSSDINPSDPSLVNVTGDNDIPSSARVDDYGYASDSDLDDCDDDTKTPTEDCTELSEYDSLSVGSHTLVMSSKQSRMDESFTENKGEVILVGSSERNQSIVRLRSLESRHILVRDTAFQTWFTLLSYLYTGRFSFLPLNSAMPGGRPKSSSSADGPRCSAKSMYRLASKVGLDCLRDKALSHIRSNLTEHNILKELSCSLVSKYPQLLEMELDELYSHIGSPPVITNFAALAQRIANKELPHGADIIVSMHARLLKAHHSFSLNPVGPGVGTSDVPGTQAKPEVGPPHVDKQGTRSESLPTASISAATSTREPDGGGKRTAPIKRK